MRGFAFIGGEGPSAGIDLGIVPGDVVVAADSGLSLAAELAIRADWVVGDMDSLADSSLLDVYPADRVRRFPREKDDTDTEIALALLAELGCDQRVIVGGGGGRLDHLLALAELFERADAPDRWITAAEDVALLAADRTSRSVSIGAPRGTLVSLFPLGTGPWTASSRGLKWPLGGLSWERGRFGISNVVDADGSRIDVETGRFLLVLPLGSSWLPTPAPSVRKPL